MSCRTCDGRCCAVFPLPKDARTRFAAGANGDDGPFILLMLVSLTRDQARARAERIGYELPKGWFENDDGSPRDEHDLYTCRHWDEETRLCSAYERRPRMCSEYPYGGDCDHGACDYREPDDRLVMAS